MVVIVHLAEPACVLLPDGCFAVDTIAAVPQFLAGPSPPPPLPPPPPPLLLLLLCAAVVCCCSPYLLRVLVNWAGFVVVLSDAMRAFLHKNNVFHTASYRFLYTPLHCN